MSPYESIRDSVIQESEKRGAAMPHVRSRERVRSQAEVYTRNEEINAMLDLMEDVSYNIEVRFLEPACGNGNFLVRILERKLARVASRYRKQKDFEFYSLMALASVYGVDILPSNVDEARERLKVALSDRYSSHLNTKKPVDGFWRTVAYILDKNIIVGDMLNGTANIRFTEFTSPKLYKFRQAVYLLGDLMADEIMGTKAKPKPVEETAMKNYWELDGNV